MGQYIHNSKTDWYLAAHALLNIILLQTLLKLKILLQTLKFNTPLSSKQNMDVNIITVLILNDMLLYYQLSALSFRQIQNIYYFLVTSLNSTYSELSLDKEFAILQITTRPPHHRSYRIFTLNVQLQIEYKTVTN